MTNPFKAYRLWRDRKFRERIDRVYFHADEHGNKEMQGNLFINGSLFVKDNVTIHCLSGNPLKKDNTIVEL